MFFLGFFGDSLSSNICLPCTAIPQQVVKKSHWWWVVLFETFASSFSLLLFIVVYMFILFIVVQFILASPVELFPTLDSEAEATTRCRSSFCNCWIIIIVIDHQPHWSLFIILAKWWFSNNLYSLYQVNESLKLVNDSEKWNQVGSDENVYDLLNSSYEYWTNLNPWRWLSIYYKKVSSEVIYEEGQHWLHSLYT